MTDPIGASTDRAEATIIGLLDHLADREDALTVRSDECWKALSRVEAAEAKLARAREGLEKSARQCVVCYGTNEVWWPREQVNKPCGHCAYLRETLTAINGDKDQ